jgi:PAS domain S-box-containing protein
MAPDAQRIVHELAVHQIELELQNEELQRARAEVEEALARYTDLYDLAPAGYLTLGRDGGIRQVNLTGARLLGLERSRLVGRRLGLLVAAECRRTFDAFLAKIFKSGAKETCEVSLRPEGATQLALELTGTAADDGQQCRVVATNITERKQLQASVAQADRLASMGMLAAGVAHEINNPLSYVLYNVESLAEDLPKLAAAAKRCCTALRDLVGDAAFAEIAGDGAEILRPAGLDDAVDRAREALGGTHRIKDVVRVLGTFSRVERVELSRIDSKYAIQAAINMVSNEIKYRARLVIDLREVPWIWASEGKLTQVLLNLLINAAQAIDEGDVDRNRITVRNWTEGNDVFVEVADTGTGIPRENLSLIFEPFFTTKAVGKGSGLGLAICRNLVTELGGDIRVESQVGKGTRFVIRLPVKSAELDERPRVAVPEAAQVPSIRGRILVVDDEPAIRAMMKRLIGREHEVVTAASGTQGQAILEQDPSFDVILCDLMMPEMTGMDLHEWLVRRNPALAAQMAFITGGAFTPRASEYLAGVGNLRIEKPFDAANLRKLVSKLILAARSRPQTNNFAERSQRTDA